jgi:hypothetical protein
VKRSAFLATAFAMATVIAVPISGGGTGATSGGSARVAGAAVGSTTFVVSAPKSVTVAGAVVSPEASASKSITSVSPDGDHVAEKSAPTPGSRVGGATAPVRRTRLVAKTRSCPSNVGGATNSAPGTVSTGGVQGTTSADLSDFAHKMNAIRVAHCLEPIPLTNVKYDSCMEQRLFWMAEDPSTNPNSAWGHIGSKRSDGVPSVGCDGNIAGGSGDTGTTVAQFDGNFAGVCILFAMTHGGIPNEPTSFTRAASRWVTC